MEIIDRYLTHFFRRRQTDEPAGSGRAIITAILEDFLSHADWLEGAEEMTLLESAMKELTDGSLNAPSTFELLQTVRAQVSLLRVKLAIGAVANAALRRRLQRLS